MLQKRRGDADLVVALIVIAILATASIAAAAQLRNVEWEPMNIEFSEGGNRFSRTALLDSTAQTRARTLFIPGK